MYIDTDIYTHTCVFLNLDRLTDSRNLYKYFELSTLQRCPMCYGASLSLSSRYNRDNPSQAHKPDCTVHYSILWRFIECLPPDSYETLPWTLQSGGGVLSEYSLTAALTPVRHPPLLGLAQGHSCSRTKPALYLNSPGPCKPRPRTWPCWPACTP